MMRKKSDLFKVFWVTLTITVLLPIGYSARAQEEINVLQMQRNLTMLGFDPGPLDGRWGSNTEAALAEFLEEEGLPYVGDGLEAYASILGRSVRQVRPGIGGGCLIGTAENRPLEMLEPNLRQYRVLGMFGIPEVPTSQKRFATADLDADGDSDFIVTFGAFPPQPVSSYPPILLRNHNGMLLPERVDNLHSEFVQVREITFGDINCDGFLDILFGATGYDQRPFPGETSGVFLSNEEGRYRDISNSVFLEDEFVHSVAVGDLDGDGAPELVLGDQTGSVRGYGRNNPRVIWYSRSRLIEEPLPSQAGNILAMEVADVDLDGSADLVLCTGLGETNKILFGDGFGGFPRIQDLPAGSFGLRATTCADVDIGDVDGNGFPDILMSQTRNTWQGRALQLLLQQEDGSFLDGSANIEGIVESDNWIWSARLIDRDVDGDLDIITDAVPRNAPNRFVNNGDGTFSGTSGLGQLGGFADWYYIAINEGTGATYGSMIDERGLFIDQVD